MTQALKARILSRVEKDLAEVEAALHDNLNPNLALVSDIAGHLLFSGGKRLRPLLFVLSARMCGYGGRDAVSFSTIFEYLHAATLLHDDVVDKADMRRGKSAAHTRWGAPRVVLTGDFLLARSLSIAASTGLPGVINVIAGITEEMSQGEIDQMEKQGRVDLTEEEYMAVIQGKTAVLIQGACQSGAIVAGAGPEKEQALADYGYHLGVAFQMADDLLDYTAQAEELGKNPGADLREGKLTLPLIYALSQAVPDERAWMESVIRDPDFNESDFQRLVSMLHEYRGIDYTRERAGYHVEKAKESLGLFPASTPGEILAMLADYAVARKI